MLLSTSIHLSKKCLLNNGHILTCSLVWIMIPLYVPWPHAKRTLPYLSLYTMKLNLGAIVGPAIVTQLLEHSQVLTFPTIFHTVVIFLSHKCSSESCHSEGQSCGEFHLHLHPHDGTWLIVILISNNLKSLTIIKTLTFLFLLILQFKRTERSVVLFSEKVL